MSILADLQNGLEQGKMLAGAKVDVVFDRVAQHNPIPDEESRNALVLGDNLAYMQGLLENGYEGRFRLIYIDPPFFTKSKFNATIDLKDRTGKNHKIKHLAYDDTFERSLECYVENMTARLILMRKLLAEDGLIWVHLDWHSAHYMKLIMDEVFGAKNFQNEIIWQYKSGGSGKRHFSRKHDTILVYSKTAYYHLNVPKEKSYNRGLKPYRFKGVKEYKDEYGWYTMVNMKDVWSIDMVGRTSAERNGYATQKPTELLRRIIEATTEEGDYCADFFCGSGTLPETAEALNRHWVGCDTEPLAISTTRKRLEAREGTYDYYRQRTGNKYGWFSVEVEDSVPLENGKNMYTCKVNQFRPEIDYGHIPLKDRDLAMKIGIEAPEQYIDHVMVDPDYDGTFRGRHLISETPSQFQFQSNGNYAIILVDVFGKEYFYDGRKEKR